ncbi:hypothetical protein MKW94_021539 [Papaver nudicaule]|uniref:Methyltransferase-like protein 13 n=1 Tax=Papaver nudicaule TaxID=74823 RepID=A0AA41VHZ7_PAPNU|nr:hypothetical protein [Papaver nudicaule]
MAVDKGTFENLVPSQFISFTFPNPHSRESTINCSYGNFLRIAILDSPVQTSDPTQIAAMLIPIDRKNDWIFSTKAGHFQLLTSLPEISRLILIGNLPRGDGYLPVNYDRPILDDKEYRAEFEEALLPLLIAVSPIAYIKGLNENFEIPFVTYEDNVISSVLVEKCYGSCVGEMIVEDVEIENVDKSLAREFRRRLRFKRMPNLVQTEMRIVPDRIEVDSVNLRISEMKFELDISCLVHPYLAPMVASLSLIAQNLDKCVCLGLKPRVLCVGIGGGALLTFLRTQFGFEVFGVENDKMVVNVAKRYFGLVEGEFLRILVGEGIDVINSVARRGVQAGFAVSIRSADSESDQHLTTYGEDESKLKFDIIMVDLDSNDAMNGPGAPPLDFVQNSILLDAKMALNTLGILVVNVIPLSKSFYEVLICELRKIFSELYEINVGNEENYVIIASVSPISSHNEVENSVQEKLKMANLGHYIECIRRI